MSDTGDGERHSQQPQSGDATPLQRAYGHGDAPPAEAPIETEPPLPVHAIANTDFLAAQRANRRATFWLLTILTLVAGAFGYLIGWVIETQTTPEGPYGPAPVLFLSGLGVGAAVGLSVFSVFWSGISLAFGDNMIMSFAGGKEIGADDQPMLNNIVEEMAIASGLPKPRIFVLETAVPNAFATGLTPQKSAIGVTRGLLDKLTRNELQGVIAHEMGHIANADIRYMTVVGVTVGLIALVSEVVLRSLRFMGGGGSSRRKGGGAIILVIILVVFAILAPLAAKLVQFAVSRQREYLADATAVRFTRNPLGLVSALRKLEAEAAPFPGASQANQHMFIVNPLRRFGEKAAALTATHPATKLRIDRLLNMRM